MQTFISASSRNFQRYYSSKIACDMLRRTPRQRLSLSARKVKRSAVRVHELLPRKERSEGGSGWRVLVR